jgi:hypothetical protein
LLHTYGGEINEKLLDDINKKILDNTDNPEDDNPGEIIYYQSIKTGIEELNKRKEDRDRNLLADANFINVYKNLILHGNLNFEHLNSGINDDIADGINDDADNNIIGHVMLKAIKSITKAELDEIELRDPERYEKIKKSGFNTLIKLNDICARDGDNDGLIKILIKHGGDFIVFRREFGKMMVNKEMIKNLLDIKPSPPQQASANIEPSPPQQASANIEPSTPQEASLPLSFLETMTRLQLAGQLFFEKLLPSQLKKDLHKQDQVSNLIDSFLGIYYNRTSPNKIKATTPNPTPSSPLISPRQGRRSASPISPAT